MAKKKDLPQDFDNLAIETELWDLGYKYIACVDEVGRGSFAGPVCAAAVIMPVGVIIPGLTDSKGIKKKDHMKFAELVKEKALCWAVGTVDANEIDRINILQATRLAMKYAIEDLAIKPDFLLVDGKEVIDLSIRQKSVISGDLVVHGISAASIIAKVYRDNLMGELDQQYGNVYGWASNAGYPSPNHIELTKKYGITPYHRQSWNTMQKL